MAIIAMAVFSTAENGKDQYLERTLASLRETVDFRQHRLGVSVNEATTKTWQIIESFSDIISICKTNYGNIGTAEAVNKVWLDATENEHCVKMDDDVVIHQQGWLDVMCEIANCNPNIGQIGLKRKDLIESPTHENEFYRSQIITVKTLQGSREVEKCHHIMGTCVLHSRNLLNVVGYMWQPRIYGFDDTFMSLRSELAGFENVFLSDVDIDHIDSGATPYQAWKEQQASETWDEYRATVQDYKDGIKDVYYNPFEV